jgi:nitrogen regulatory protein PII
VKLVLIAHNAAIEAEVNEALDAVGLDAYTKLPDALGKGHTSEPHLGNDVWPGTNTVTLVAVADDQVAPLLDRIRTLRSVFGTEGVKAFVLPIEAAT